jgi:hypothetical protein
MGVSSLPIEAPLLPVSAARNDNSPVATYLGRLAAGSRRGQLDALNTIARLLTKGSADAEGVNWASLKYPQTAAIRAALTERYAPNTTKRMLAALRGVLKECWAWFDGPRRVCSRGGYCPCSWTIASAWAGLERNRTRSIVQKLPRGPKSSRCT